MELITGTKEYIKGYSDGYERGTDKYLVWIGIMVMVSFIFALSNIVLVCVVNDQANERDRLINIVRENGNQCLIGETKNE